MGLLLVGLSLVAPIFTFAGQEPCPFSWTRDLRSGMSGNDVTALQQYLSVTPRSGWFGPVTKTAVIAFQERYAADILTPNGLTSGSGFVGPATRAKLNALCGTVLGATSGRSTLTVSVPTQPAHILAPANALYVPFTTFVLTAGDAPITVSSVMVERVGPGTDQLFSSIDLLERDGDYSSTVYGFNSLHRAVFRDPLIIPARSSVTIDVVGDMNADLTDQDGQMVGFKVIAITADAPLSGTPLPIIGTYQTANASIKIGSVSASLGSDDPRGTQTRYINDTNVRFSSVRMDVGSAEDVRLNAVTWEQSGSAASTDITNVRTVIKGVSYPAVTTDGRYYTSTIPNGLVIKKGDSVEATIMGDLTVSGSGRTIEFDIDDGSDFDFTGLEYGFGIFMLPGDNTDIAGAHSAFITSDGTTDGVSGRPYYAGSLTRISGGAVNSISR